MHILNALEFIAVTPSRWLPFVGAAGCSFVFGVLLHLILFCRLFLCDTRGHSSSGGEGVPFVVFAKERKDASCSPLRVVYDGI